VYVATLKVSLLDHSLYAKICPYTMMFLLL